MADKTKIPRPLGWCSRCLARGAGEHPAVTMNHGSGLCRECNAVVDQQQRQDLIAGLAAQAQHTVSSALHEARSGLSRALHAARPS